MDYHSTNVLVLPKEGSEIMYIVSFVTKKPDFFPFTHEKKV